MRALRDAFSDAERLKVLLEGKTRLQQDARTTRTAIENINREIEQIKKGKSK